MGAGVGAGGTGIESADFAGGEGVEELLAGLVEGLKLEDLAAEVAEFGEPGAEVERESVVELLAEALSERGGVAGGGDGDLEIAAADERREVEVAVGRVVDGVAEDRFGGGFEVDRAVDFGDVGGGDDEEGLVGDVACGVRALVPGELAGGVVVLDRLAGLGSDDGDAGVGCEEGFDLRLGQVARTDDDAGA